MSNHDDVDGLDLEAEIDIHFGLASEVSRLTKAIKQLTGEDYAVTVLRRTGTIHPGTPLVIDLGTPAAGKAWDTRMVTVSPVSPFTADAADLAYVAIGSINIGLPFADIVGFAQHVPFTTFPKSLAWPVRMQQTLYVVTSAMTTPLNATATVIEVPDLPEVLAKL